jgi:ribosomal protein L24E
MTKEHTYKHKHTRLSSEARKKVCRSCKSARGTLLSYYLVDDKPAVLAFCTQRCADTFKQDNKPRKTK